MQNYLIGAGAVLTAGNESSITAATLHAQTEAPLASGVRAALFDFEAGNAADLSRVVIVAAGWTAARVRSGIVEPLTRRGTCTLADVLALLAQATGTPEVHCFARWLPGDRLIGELSGAGVTVVAHPLESIRQAALICGQRYSRWPSPLKAA